jgi:hypothetical protein
MPNENIPLVDGSMLETRPDATWDLTLPSGKHIRGHSATQAAAKAAAFAEHDAYVLGQWAKGSPIAGGRFLTTL